MSSTFLPPPSFTSPQRLRFWYRLGAYGDYEGMDATTEAQARAVDRQVYLLTGVLMAATFAGGLGLIAINEMALFSVLLTLFATAGAVASVVRAWLVPHKLKVGTLWRVLAAFVLLYVFQFGVLIFRSWGANAPSWGQVWHQYLLLPQWSFGLVFLVGTLLQLAVLVSRRAQIQRELERLQLEAERDAAARQAAEARLQLLRAQIQPHFIFNTLAALQHWVDTGDARAPGLLRTLTSFLRGSTELLANEQVTLADELVLARHYLAIMQVRLGERLRFDFDIDEGSQRQTLPPGLLLTLLENAVEHGIAPALHPGSISVRSRHEARSFELAVLNGGLPLAADWYEGLGLANCRERLQHRFGSAARLSLQATGQGTLAQVQIDG